MVVEVSPPEGSIPEGSIPEGSINVELNLIDVTPAPALRRIVTLDDRVLGSMKVLGGVAVG